jgi:hypothetical protein
MIFADTLQTYRERLNGDQSLKERSNAYREQRITALLKSWSDLNQMDVAQISKTDGLAWPRDSGKPRVRRLSTIPFGTFKLVLDFAVEAGARVTTTVPSTSNGKNSTEAVAATESKTVR